MLINVVDNWGVYPLASSLLAARLIGTVIALSRTLLTVSVPRVLSCVHCIWATAHRKGGRFLAVWYESSILLRGSVYGKVGSWERCSPNHKSSTHMHHQLVIRMTCRHWQSYHEHVDNQSPNYTTERLLHEMIVSIWCRHYFNLLLSTGMYDIELEYGLTCIHAALQICL